MPNVIPRVLKNAEGDRRARGMQCEGLKDGGKDARVGNAGSPAKLEKATETDSLLGASSRDVAQLLSPRETHVRFLTTEL